MAAGLVLTACGGLPMVAEQAPSTAPADPASAVAYYDARARQASSPRREALRLSAAEAALRAGDVKGARARLADIDVSTLHDALILRKQTLLARAQLASDEAAAAVASLALIDTELAEVPAAQRAVARTVRARARARTGDTAGAIRDRALAAARLSGAEEDRNRAALLELLREAEPRALQSALDEVGPGIVGSWLELGLSLHGDAGALARWRDRYPNHPALGALEGELPARGRSPARAQPAQSIQPVGPITGTVAVLLPLSGGLAAVAEAVEAGMLEAHYGAGGRAVELRFYDTEANGAAAAYDAAVADGAAAVIGPLRKEAVAALAQRRTLPVPTLALNAPEHRAVAQRLFMLSLDPRDEVEAAVEHAWQRGLRRAAVLYPDDAWGERLFELMRDTWTGRGGVVSTVQAYAPQGRDQSEPVAALLGLADGAQRHRRVQRVVGAVLAYEPVPRQDVDVLLLAASAAQARLIEPQLRYRGAGALPVYATAQVWDLASPAAQNRDLDGVHFCDTPRTLGGTADGTDGAKGSALMRLHALGADAYRSLLRLDELIGGEVLRGDSGTLRIRPDGRIARALPCARFEAGVPRPLDDAQPLAAAP